MIFHITAILIIWERCHIVPRGIFLVPVNGSLSQGLMTKRRVELFGEKSTFEGKLTSETGSNESVETGSVGATVEAAVVVLATDFARKSCKLNIGAR